MPDLTFWPGVLVGIWLCMGAAFACFLLTRKPIKPKSIDYCDLCGTHILGAMVLHADQPFCVDCSIRLQMEARRAG